MSDQAPSTSSPLKVFLGAMGVFVFFGFLVLILSGYAGHESIEDRAYMGVFDTETIEQRWANLEEIETTQSGLLDEEKVAKAMASLSKKAPKATKSSVVVPGSPTFMKQMEEASSPAPEDAPKSDEVEAKPKKAAPQPAKEAPKAPKADRKEAKPKAAPKGEATPKAKPSTPKAAQ